jgi:hypothetical protein
VYIILGNESLDGCDIDHVCKISVSDENEGFNFRGKGICWIKLLNTGRRKWNKKELKARFCCKIKFYLCKTMKYLRKITAFLPVCYISRTKFKQSIRNTNEHHKQYKYITRNTQCICAVATVELRPAQLLYWQFFTTFFRLSKQVTWNGTRLVS